jgi:hypothetical protein
MEASWRQFQQQPQLDSSVDFFFLTFILRWSGLSIFVNGVQSGVLLLKIKLKPSVVCQKKKESTSACTLFLSGTYNSERLHVRPDHVY